MFVEFFIRRPIFAAVCSILIVLAGALAIPRLPIALYPQVALPQVVVTSTYTGANSEVVESAVTIPLEQAINGAEGMRYISSVSGNDGTSQITITFDLSRDLDVAAVDVQNRVSTAQARLPNEVKQTGVTVTKASSAFVMALGLVAEHGEYDQKFLSNYADIYLRDALKRVPGVGDVRIFGERRFAMRLWIDPDKLAERGLVAADVVNALAEQNVQVPAGRIGDPPAPTELSYQISLQVEGRLAEESQFENIVIRANPDGTLIRVKDIGRAELGAENYSSTLRFNGQSAIGLGVLQLTTANALSVRNGVVATMDSLAKRFPPGLRYALAFDTTRAVASSMEEVVFTLIEAIGLVVVVIFIFLQTGRSTLIPAIAIPVSLVGTFAFVKLFGFSINTLTLFGLTLATGLVVDDAIVVIENIQRHIDDEGLSVHQAAVAAMREVTGAVVATSLVLMAVFAPVAFLPGTTGRIYQQFSLTIAFSVALSLFNSLTLTPALSARLLSRTKERKGAFFRRFDALFTKTRTGYLALLGWLVRRRLVTLAFYGVLVGAGVLLFIRVPSGFLPEEDQGYFIVNIQGPSGTSLGYTSHVVEGTEETLRKVPEVQTMFSVGGFSFAGTAPNRALMFVLLKPWSERKGQGQTLADIVQRLRGPLLGNPEALVLPLVPPAIQGVGSFGGFQFEVEEQGAGTVSELADTTQAIVGSATRSPSLQGIFTSFTADDPLLYLRVDRERAKALNIPVTDVFQALQISMGSQYVNDFTFSNRSYRVYVQADARYRGNPKDLTAMYVRSRGRAASVDAQAAGVAGAGASTSAPSPMVSLDTLLTSEARVSAAQISHYNLFRSAEINGSPARGRSSGDALREMERIARGTLPQGFDFEWTGIAKEQVEAGNATLIIFALALVLVLLVLAAQYESFSLPFIVLLSVPLGVVGALGAVMIRHQANDVFCQIGLVMLIGLSAKNAILIVEFATQLRERGLGIADAAIEAARERLRPIVMTSLAFILGVFPLVIATGSGAESRRSLGTTVFGGMLVSTLMVLLFVPPIYIMIETLRERVLRRKPDDAERPAEPTHA